MGIAIKIVLTTAAPLLLVTGVVLSSPAAAIEGEAAAVACEKRPGACFAEYLPDGGVDIYVCNAGESCRTIHCPPKGACGFTSLRTPKGGKPVAGAAGNVMGILFASPATTQPLPSKCKIPHGCGSTDGKGGGK
jgi:hypothetical protein